MNNYSSSRNIRLPGWLDRFSAWAAQLPWWLILVVTGLIILFFSFYSSNLYREILRWVTDDPRWEATRFARVDMQVRMPDGSQERITGTILSEDATSITVETVAEGRFVVPLRDVGAITCESPDANGNCPVGSLVTLAQVSGFLIREDLGRYFVTDVPGEQGNQVEIQKVSTDRAREVREPAGCAANPEGECVIRLTLNPDSEQNIFRSVRLVEQPADVVVLQLAPAQSTKINRTDVISQTRINTGQCALNNVSGCDAGLWLTLFITVGAFILAAVLGLIFALMRISTSPVLFHMATTYVEVVRGVPLLVILLFANFVFAPWFRVNFPVHAPGLTVALVAFGFVVAAFVVWNARVENLTTGEIVQALVLVGALVGVLVLLVQHFGTNSSFSPPQIAILGLGFGYGAFLAELFRAGIQSIGKGQMEAARSLGMTYVQAMTNVVLPQAFRVVLPPLGNEFIAVLKDSSLAALIAVPELTQQARLYAARNFQVFPSYITIGALYLIMTLLLSFVVRTIERRLTTAGR